MPVDTDATAAAAPADRRTGALRRGARLVRAEVRLHPRPFALAVAGAAVYAVATVGLSWSVGRATDRLIEPRFAGESLAWPAVAAGLGLVLALGVVRAAAVVVRRLNATRAQVAVRSTLRAQVVDHYQAQPLAWHQSHPTGELLARTDTDAEAAVEVLAPLPYASSVVILVVVAAVLLLATDPVLGGVALLVVPVVAAVNTLYERRLERPNQQAQEGLAEVARIVHESVDGALVVKALGAEAREVERLASAAGRLRDAKVRIARTVGTFEAVLDAVPSLATVLVIGVGALRVGAGAVTAGQVVAIVLLFNLLVWPLRISSYAFASLPRSLAGFERIQGVLADRAEPPVRPSPPPDGSDVEVALDGVWFSHEPGRPVLRDVTFSVRRGTTVAIVGPVAAGKSTLLHLVAGLLGPERGTVTAPVGAVALVFQEPFLFAETVADNVVAGRPGAAAALDEALAVAQAGFVDELPAGRATLMGERGITVSGGQRQRLALARALAGRPRVLLLDDTTSALDPVTEARILSALAERAAGTTVLLVASRPSTIALADEVVYLVDGRVVDHGPHHVLVARQPGYRHLVESYERARDRDAGPSGEGPT